MKSAIVIRVEGLNGKARKQAGFFPDTPLSAPVCLLTFFAPAGVAEKGWQMEYGGELYKR
jgi:hypothetical protein